MKRISIILLLGWLTLSAFAQQINCPTEMHNGTLAYKYKVQKGEGLYGLSIRFGVSQEEILKMNPQVATQGLRFDEYVFIPVKGEAMLDACGVKIQEHTIAAHETVYGLAKRYGSSEAAIMAANPVMAKKMFVGEVLRIPTGSPEQLKLYAEALKDKEKAKTAAKEEVKPVAETVSAMPAAESAAETPAASAAQKVAELKKNEELKPIVVVAEPAKQEVKEAVVNDEVAAIEETALPQVDDVEAVGETDAEIHSAEPLKLVYLLPLMANQQKRDAQSDRFADFYEGALLAVRDWQEQSGVRVQVSTYDTQKSEDYLRDILFFHSSLSAADAIIGPAMPGEVAIVAQHAKQHHIPMLVPFTQKVPDIQHNPYLMQFNPSQRLEAEVLVAHWQRKGNVHCVFLGTEGAEIVPSVQALMSAIGESGITHSATSLRSILSDSLQYVLKEGAENVLIFNTDKYASMQVFLPRVQMLSEQYSLVLYSHYSWQHERIPMSQVYTTVFSEPDAASLPAYTEAYERYYGAHALASVLPRYDLLGYDLTKSLLERIYAVRESHADWTSYVPNDAYQGIQSAIDFMSVGNGGGLENVDIRVVEK